MREVRHVTGCGSAEPEVSVSAGSRGAEGGRGPAAPGWREGFLRREMAETLRRDGETARFIFGASR